MVGGGYNICTIFNRVSALFFIILVVGGVWLNVSTVFMALEILDDISLEQKSSWGRQSYTGRPEKEGKKP